MLNWVIRGLTGVGCIVFLLSMAIFSKNCHAHEFEQATLGSSREDDAPESLESNINHSKNTEILIDILSKLAGIKEMPSSENDLEKVFPGDFVLRGCFYGDCYYYHKNSTTIYYSLGEVSKIVFAEDDIDVDKDAIVLILKNLGYSQTNVFDFEYSVFKYNIEYKIAIVVHHINKNVIAIDIS